MTDEEKQAVEKLHNGKKMDLISIIRAFKREGIENFVVTKKETVETVLNLIEKQQAELEKYKEMYVVSVADRVNSAFEQKHKNDEDLEMLYKGCQIEIKNKDKIIDEMAISLYNYANLGTLIKCPAEYDGRYNLEKCKMNLADRNCVICIEEYFKKKVEDK